MTRYMQSWVDNVCGVVLISIREAQGRIAELLPLADLGLRETPPKPYWHGLAAAAAFAAGHRGRARSERAKLADEDFESLVPDLGYVAKLAMLAPAIVGLREAEWAALLHEKLLPFAGKMVWNGVCVHGSVDDVLAQLSTLG